MTLLIDLFIIWVINIFCPPPVVPEPQGRVDEDGFFVIDHFDSTSSHNDHDNNFNYDQDIRDTEFPYEDCDGGDF